ncbi:transposase [Streptococcus pneumoniae]|nr:transposase [Streptococcus pneumoniae]VNA12928.1 transposase [Streptococcus pneumoniae]VNL19333.1 transposase [Streptococcus pneumoniae]VQC42399.1 transposase [Streptococcus pneumoniae]VQN77711.1 transposase [Streptococcus pneumoniae]
MSRVRVQIMNQFHRKSHEYKAIKRYWKLIQQDSRKLSDKRFYRPTCLPKTTSYASGSIELLAW